ncbi:DUF4144 family protein [Colwellia ponticola]|uniref:Uncharacterized protein n=1 Tax=Colwellia ponticola TaxID=2304625 RepID=A0A8H2PK43_9GAMM|nr:DUF4144 family protein [Colwellia ponticola]TMM43999.1 hypothetical protein FCS21_11365 [Colwellia ponticola]
MIFWPCILTLAGDDELIYLASAGDLIAECQALIFTDDDYVIDSRGFCYVITKQLALHKTAREVTVDEVCALIRAHEFQKATLCLTKIHFATIADAIHSIRY